MASFVSRPGTSGIPSTIASGAGDVGTSGSGGIPRELTHTANCCVATWPRTDPNVGHPSSTLSTAQRVTRTSSDLKQALATSQSAVHHTLPCGVTAAWYIRTRQQPLSARALPARARAGSHPRACISILMRAITQRPSGADHQTLLGHTVMQVEIPFSSVMLLGTRRL